MSKPERDKDSPAGVPDSDDWGAPVEAQDIQSTDQVRFDPAYLGDRYFYRVVVWSLAGVALVALVGAIALVAYGKNVPEFVVAIGSPAVGALAGVVAGNRM